MAHLNSHISDLFAYQVERSIRGKQTRITNGTQFGVRLIWLVDLARYIPL